jgi:Lon protease-like protein
LEGVPQQLPMFPLNSVMFPGVTQSLHVFEDRYRALVHHLLTIADKTDRVFGVVAIREGYEVGSHGTQSVHRLGSVVQMTSVEPHADGRFDIEVVGRQRMRLRAMDSTAAYLIGTVDLLDDAEEGTDAAHEAELSREMFEAYRQQLSRMQGAEVLDGDLPDDPAYLSYSLAATCLLTLRERQELLEVDSARERLILLRHSLREEMRAMRAVPSLPATQVARTGWSPN